MPATGRTEVLRGHTWWGDWSANSDHVASPTPSAVLPACSCVQVKDHYSSILNRRNTLTGILYKDDPTIFRHAHGEGCIGGWVCCWQWAQRQRSLPILLSADAAHSPPSCNSKSPLLFSWNLMNEARCKGCGPEPIDSWVGKIAAHVKVGGRAAPRVLRGSAPAHGNTLRPRPCSHSVSMRSPSFLPFPFSRSTPTIL